jgi:A/G-specific adenine glycosylase
MILRRTAAALLQWYSTNARNLPWRRTSDPYAVWISEVMLQQTQVQTVIPYWERWMKALPHVRALAKARLDTILKLWEGLGYYTRARHLHAAAQVIVDQHHDTFPQEFETVLALPGIGRYTAGAICSIAFNQPTPILDGNVVRVLSRIYGIEENTRLPAVNRRLWQEADRLVQTATTLTEFGRSCSMLNQALMELGAIVCVPKNPACARCPLHRGCQARKAGATERLPNTGKRPGTERREFVAFVVWDGKRVLMRQRPAGVVNAHLWEFPNFELAGDSGREEFAAFGKLGIDAKDLELLGTIRHSITRFRIDLKVYQVHAGGAARLLRAGGGHWCTLQQLDDLALPSAHRKIVRRLRNAKRQSPTLPNS